MVLDQKVLGFMSYLTKVLKCASVNINDEVVPSLKEIANLIKRFRFFFWSLLINPSDRNQYKTS